MMHSCRGLCKHKLGCIVKPELDMLKTKTELTDSMLSLSVHIQIGRIRLDSTLNMKQSFAVGEFVPFRIQSFMNHISSIRVHKAIKLQDYKNMPRARDLASNLATRREALKEMLKSDQSELKFSTNLFRSRTKLKEENSLRRC